MTLTPTHWVVYDTEDERYLCVNGTASSSKVLWEKNTSTRYILLDLENIEFIEKFIYQLVTADVDAEFDCLLNKLVINFLTIKSMWGNIIFVPIVGKQYHGHTRCDKLPEHLDFINAFRI